MLRDNFNVSVSYELQINSIYVASLDIQVVALLHKSVDMLCHTARVLVSFSSFFFFRVFVRSRDAVGHVDQFGQDSLYPVGFVSSVN